MSKKYWHYLHKQLNQTQKLFAEKVVGQLAYRMFMWKKK
uniref:Uncharacterized protein n=1 Tax=Anguilla anguilla TaxID=7936 RepID=A0A0E9VAL4_ANGAN